MEESAKKIRNGVVKWFSYERGYGFIEVSGQKDIFLPISGLDFQYKLSGVRPGDPVTYEVQQSQRGPRAIHVKRRERV